MKKTSDWFSFYLLEVQKLNFENNIVANQKQFTVWIMQNWCFKNTFLCDMTLKYFVLYSFISLIYLFLSFGTGSNFSLWFKCAFKNNLTLEFHEHPFHEWQWTRSLVTRNATWKYLTDFNFWSIWYQLPPIAESSLKRYLQSVSSVVRPPTIITEFCGKECFFIIKKFQ